MDGCENGERRMKVQDDFDSTLVTLLALINEENEYFHVLYGYDIMTRLERVISDIFQENKYRHDISSRGMGT